MTKKIIIPIEKIDRIVLVKNKSNIKNSNEIETKYDLQLKLLSNKVLELTNLCATFKKDMNRFKLKRRN